MEQVRGRGWRVAFAWVGFAVLLLLLPSGARSHGTVSHVPGEADFGVSVGRYQFLIEGKERSVSPGERDRIVVRVFDMKTGKPAGGGRVLVAPRIPQAFSALPPKNGTNPASAAKGHGDTHAGNQEAAGPPPGSFLSWTKDGRPDLRDFQTARESSDPGHYAFDFTPSLKGPHLLQVAYLPPGAPEGKEHLLTQLFFEVKPPARTSFRMWISLGGIFIAFVVGAYAIRVRATRPPLSVGAFNLLELRWFSRLMRSPAWRPMFQVPFLVVFAVLLYLGFADTQESSRNLSTLGLWTLWWAGIIFTFVLAGRAWCFMCPIGALNEWANQITGSQRQFPRRYRTLWFATVSFLLLTWADGFYGIIRSPYRTASLFLLFMVIAVVVGALFARRSFCRYLCPIGGIIGLYSMFAPVELRAGSATTCSEDPGKFCYVGNEAGEGCPMFEFPQRMDSNTYCIYCGECLNTCSLGNIVIRLRPFGKDLWNSVRRTFDESALGVIMVAVSGAAAGHMVTPWHDWMHALSGFIPFAALGITDHAAVERWTFTLVFLGVVFLAMAVVYLVGVATWLLSRRSADSAPGDLFILFGYAFIPLGLAMHLAHNLPHLFLEGPMAIPVFIKTVNHYTPLYLGAPDFQIKPWLEMPVLYWLQMVILLVASLYSLYIAYRLSLARWGASAILTMRGPWPYLALILAIALTNAFLLNLPMDARH